MTTQVPGTQDEDMPDAHLNGRADGQYDDDIIVGKEDLVIRVVSVVSLVQRWA